MANLEIFELIHEEKQTLFDIECVKKEVSLGKFRYTEINKNKALLVKQNKKYKVKIN